MKQSFGPESTLDVVLDDTTDATADISLPHTVKSDSPASAGAVVGVTSSGAWSQSRDPIVNNDVIIYDDYESEEQLPDLQNSYIDANDHIVKTHDVSDSALSPRMDKQPLPKEKLKLNLSTTVVEIDEEIDATTTKSQESRMRPKSGKQINIFFISGKSMNESDLFSKTLLRCTLLTLGTIVFLCLIC